MPDKEFLNFNFSDPLEQVATDEQFLENREKSIRSKFEQKHSGTKSHGAWLLVFFLMISLVVLGTFTLVKNRENEKQIAALKEKTQTTPTYPAAKNIITAENFSLVLDMPTPTGFKLDRELVKSDFLEGKESVKASFLSKNVKAGQELTSGIQVELTEYDNKMDKTLFEETVLAKLGANYELKSQDIALPKDIKVSKIQQKDNNSNEVYYITVTLDNYYIIKIFNQTSKYPEFQEITEFTESLLPSLYLN